VNILYCLNCGKEIKDEKALYCPYCAKPLTSVPQTGLLPKRTRFPITAGILIIIAACICFFAGILCYYNLIVVGVYPIYPPLFAYSSVGIFGILGFAFGLTGGTLTIKRKNFTLSIIGICLVLLSGSVTIIVWGVWGSILFGLPIVLLSILGLIFVAVSKAEFAS
jgi:hypothetical protein